MGDVDRLFRAYHAPLVRYLTRRLGDRDWATNLVRDEARKDARRRRHLALLAEAERDTVSEQPETSAERAQEAALARRAVEALAERDRLALLMREEGLDYPEIAEALGLSVGSVGTTLARARRRLAETYEAMQREADARQARRGTYGTP